MSGARSQGPKTTADGRRLTDARILARSSFVVGRWSNNDVRRSGRILAAVRAVIANVGARSTPARRHSGAVIATLAKASGSNLTESLRAQAEAASEAWREAISTRPARNLDRGRENRQRRFPLPPNRTGGSPASGSPVSGVYIEAGWRGQGLLAWCKAQAAQSMSWASADGRCRVRGLSSCVVSSVCFAGAFGPSRLWP